MNEDNIIEILENCEIPESKVIEIVSQMKNLNEIVVQKNVVSNDNLDAEINREKNPINKASLIAKRISKNLDEGY